MKRILAVSLCLLLVLGFAACGAKTENDPSSGGAESENTKVTGVVDISADVSANTVSDSAEYDLYREVFYDKKGDDHVAAEITKTGTFTVLYDNFKGVTRYYVWGYDEKNKGNDWQWELKIKDTSSLPANGSLVEVTGKLEKSDDALDGYWFKNPTVTVKEEYEGYKCDIDMSVMSSTLERVQISNIQNYREENNGKTVVVYGKVVSENLVEHPYSSESWQMHFKTEDKVPKKGTMVVISGTFIDGMLEGAKIKAVKNY